MSGPDPLPRQVEALAEELLAAPRERLRMIPYYADARNEIVRPQRHQVITDYFMRSWLPRLGPTLTLLVITLRRHCYYNELTKQQEDWCFPHQRDLAAELGVSRRTVQRELSRPEAQLFVRREPQYRYDRERNRMIRTVDRYRITMDDPLTPEDERALVVKVAERLIRDGNLPAEPSEGGKRQSDAYGIKTPIFPQSMGPIEPGRGDNSGTTLRSRQSDAYEGGMVESHHLTPNSALSRRLSEDTGRKNSPNLRAVRDTAEDDDRPSPPMMLLNVNQSSQRTNLESASGDLLVQLRRAGVSEEVARSLLDSYEAQRITRQIDWLPHRQVRDPAAALVDAIRRDWAPPAGVRDEPSAARRGESIEARRTREDEATVMRDRDQRMDLLISSLPDSRRMELWDRAREMALRDWGDNPVPPPIMLIRAKLRALVEQEIVSVSAPEASPAPVPRAAADDLSITTEARANAFITWFERVYGIAIRSRGRTRDLVQARRIAWLVLREWGLSYARIGGLFGCDHTTVRDALQIALEDPDLRRAAASCRERFDQS